MFKKRSKNKKRSKIYRKRSLIHDGTKTFSELENNIIKEQIDKLEHIKNKYFTTKPFTLEFGSIINLKKLYDDFIKSLNTLNYDNKKMIFNKFHDQLDDAVFGRIPTKDSRIVAQPLFNMYAILCDVLNILDDSSKIKMSSSITLWVALDSNIIDYYK